MFRTIIFLSVVLLSCLHAKTISSLNNGVQDERTNKLLYNVYKIDSINNYYLIYAIKSDTLYKIVSKKEPSLSGGTLIMVKGNYSFQLSSIWTQPIIIGGVNVSPSVTPNVTCLSFDDSTRICLERDSINDLYRASNLRGLYFK